MIWLGLLLICIKELSDLAGSVAIFVQIFRLFPPHLTPPLKHPKPYGKIKIRADSESTNQGLSESGLIFENWLLEVPFWGGSKNWRIFSQKKIFGSI